MKSTGRTASIVCAAGLALALAAIAPARADDYGSHADLRAIRGSVPILLGHYLASPSAGDVVVEGNDAIATWTSGGKPGLATFHRRSDRWWLMAIYDTYGPAIGRDLAQLEGELSIPAALAVRAQQHVPNLLALQPILHQVTQPICNRCGSALWNVADGFETTLNFNAATPTWDPDFAIRGRAPSVGEMPPTPTMNAYFFFRLATKGTTPVVVQKGARLDVWFPYVLDDSKSYVLWLDFLKPDLDDIPGRLEGNTLHFTLPAFGTIPGKDAFGEIDGAV